MLNVKKLMHGVTVVDPDATIYQVSMIMAKRQVGSVLIKNGDVFGILTERDIVTKVIPKNMDIMSTTASDIMNKAITIDHTKDINDAATIFKKHNIRRLPVTKDDKIIGIVTIRDLVRKKASDITSQYYHRGMYQQGSGWG